jgi:hypothetical protein
MERNELLERLQNKLYRNLQGFDAQWRQLRTGELITKAQEIAATSTAYKELHSGDYSSDYMEYLLQFENPLELVRDKVIEEFFTPDIHQEMAHVLASIMEDGHSGDVYALDPEYAEHTAGQCQEMG